MPLMATSDLTPREYWAEVKANPNRARFGFGTKAALINIDLQRAYTDIGAYKTAYQTDPKQIDYINELSGLARAKNMPVIWTYVAYMDNADDAGVWGTRTNTPDSLQNIKMGDPRAEMDPRLDIDRSCDMVLNKRMASVFHETPIASLLVWHRVDTVILTGGSTSGCVRASAVASLSFGYRTIVPEECVADKHEIPHFANLCDMMLKYADVEPVVEVKAWLSNHPGCQPIRKARGCPF
jgi:maleamate amidohydrolase